MRPLDPVAWREHKDLLGECLSASVTSYVLNHGVGEREIVVHLTAASANAIAASQASPMTGTSRGSSERPGSKTLTMMTRAVRQRNLLARCLARRAHLSKVGQTAAWD